MTRGIARPVVLKVEMSCLRCEAEMPVGYLATEITRGKMHLFYCKPCTTEITAELAALVRRK